VVTWTYGSVLLGEAGCADAGCPKCREWQSQARHWMRIADEEATKSLADDRAYIRRLTAENRKLRSALERAPRAYR
jgi:hypothetical protein